MVHWFDAVVGIGFAAAGAILMRLVDLRVERAVLAERRRLQAGGASVKQITPRPDDEGLAPAPLVLTGADAEALRRDGAVIKRRVK